MTASTASVTLDHCIRCSSAVLVQQVGTETVLLDMASECYFGLDSIGTRIWSLLSGEAPLAHVHATLCDEFNEDPQRIEADLLALVQQLADAGLVAIV